MKDQEVIDHIRVVAVLRMLVYYPGRMLNTKSLLTVEENISKGPGKKKKRIQVETPQGKKEEENPSKTPDLKWQHKEEKKERKVTCKEEQRGRK